MSQPLAQQLKFHFLPWLLERVVTCCTRLYYSHTARCNLRWSNSKQHQWSTPTRFNASHGIAPRASWRTSPHVPPLTQDVCCRWLPTKLRSQGLRYQKPSSPGSFTDLVPRLYCKGSRKVDGSRVLFGRTKTRAALFREFRANALH